MAYTTKLTPYKTASFPSLPGGEQQYIPSELKKISQVITSLEQILAKMENTPLVVAKAGAPTTADVPLDTWKVINDTVGGTTKLYANIGGVLVSAALS